MSYVNTFTGQPAFPTSVSFLAVALSADTSFYWPSQQIDSDNQMANILDVTPSGAGYAITLPIGTAASVGAAALFRNLGASSFTVKDYSGTTVATVAAGEIWHVYLTDNTTDAGTWQTFLFGSGSSALTAASVASQSVIAMANTLNSAMPVMTKNANYTALAGDRANVIVWTGGAGTLSLTAAATLGNNWFIAVRNLGSGTLTVDPDGAELIDGASTASLAQNEAFFIFCNGSAFYTVGKGQPATITYDRLTYPVSSSGTHTLTSTEYSKTIQQFTGTLSGAVNIIEPTSYQIYYVENATTGSGTLTIKTLSGTGVVIPQSAHAILYCDGTNIESATTSNAGTVTQITTGSGLTGGPITTSGTIALATTTVIAGQYSLSKITFNAYGQATSAISAVSGTTVTGNLAAWATSGSDLLYDAAIAVTAVARLDTAQTYSAATRGIVVPVSYSSTVVLNFNSGNNFEISPATGNMTISAINVSPGQGGVIGYTQGSGGNYSITWNSIFKWPQSTAQAAATVSGSYTQFPYYTRSSTFVTVVAISGIA